MNLISIKDYAVQNNVSYEAIRQQTVRYKKELEGHIIKDNRTQFLDEEAVAFLDSKREKNPVVIIQQDKDDRIKVLEEENKTLLQRVVILQDKQLQMQEELTAQKLLAVKVTEAEERATVAEQKAAEAEKQAITARQKSLEAEIALTAAEDEKKTLSDVAELNAQEADRAKKEAEELRAELERLKSRGFWARLFNKE